VTPPVARDPRLRISPFAPLAIFGVWIVAQAITGGIANAIEGSVPDSQILFDPYITGALAIADLTLAGATLYAARNTGNVRASLGLVRPASWPRAIGLAFAALVLTYVAAAVLEPVLHGAKSQGLTPSKLPSTTHAHIGIVLGAFAFVIVAPVAEELFFRGGLFAAYRVRLGPIAMPLVSGLVFGALHLEPRALPVLALLGVLLGAIYERTGSIYPGMLLHATNNGLAFAAGFLATH
jgi:membrane protease YdiL (CAAX protease family)